MKRRKPDIKINGVSGGQINIHSKNVRQDVWNVNTDGGDFIGGDIIVSGATREEISKLFDVIYTKLNLEQNLSTEDKKTLKSEVEEIQLEVTKGKKANSGFLIRKLRNIKRIAPDILEVVIDVLENPILGFSTVGWPFIFLKALLVIWKIQLLISQLLR